MEPRPKLCSETEGDGFSGRDEGGRYNTYDQVYPKIQEVRGIKVGASSEPFGTEIHPPMQSPLHEFSRRRS